MPKAWCATCSRTMPRIPPTCRPSGAQGSTPATTPRARRVADFIAGMTDRYALIEHARLFRLDPGIALGARACNMRAPRDG